MERNLQIAVHSLVVDGFEYIAGHNCMWIERVRPGVYDIRGAEDDESTIRRVRDPKIVCYSRKD